MTIPSTARKAGPLLGTGAQTAWPFTFKVFAEADILVSVADAAGVITVQTLGADYSVALNSNQETSPGGTVTYPISGAALPVGSKLAIVGDLDYDQPLDLPSGGNFSPFSLENQLDRATMQIQQLKELSDRSAKMSVYSSNEDVEALTSGIIVLAEISTDISAVANDLANINLVVANATNINTVAGGIANVNTVGTNITNVNTVADDLNEPVSEINTVAENIADVNTVASSISAVNTVASNLSLWRDVTAGDDIQVTNFNGTGAQTTFTLPFAPGAENNTQVFISGVYQNKDQYAVAGTTITFSTAPPSGTANVEVVWSRPFVLGATDAALVGANAYQTQDGVNTERKSVKAFGAVGDGVTNDYAAFVAAGANLFVPATGTYRISTTCAVGNLHSLGGIISVDAGVVLTVDSASAQDTTVIFSGLGTVRSNQNYFSVGWFAGNSLNEKWDRCRKGFFDAKTKHVKFPEPKVGDPASVLNHYNATAWGITDTLYFEPKDNNLVVESYGRICPKQAMTVPMIIIGGLKDPTGATDFKTEDLTFTNGLLVEGAYIVDTILEIQSGARTCFANWARFRYCLGDAIKWSNSSNASDECTFENLEVSGYGGIGLNVAPQNTFISTKVNFLFTNGSGVNVVVNQTNPIVRTTQPYTGTNVLAVKGNMQGLYIGHLFENTAAAHRQVTDCLVRVTSENVVSATPAGGDFTPGTTGLVIDRITSTEQAAGVSVATTGASWSGGTATLTFSSTAIAPLVGSLIAVAGVTPSGYNGNFVVTASTTTSVSYAVAATLTVGTVNGTITVHTPLLITGVTSGTRKVMVSVGVFSFFSVSGRAVSLAYAKKSVIGKLGRTLDAIVPVNTLPLVTDISPILIASDCENIDVTNNNLIEVTNASSSLISNDRLYMAAAPTSGSGSIGDIVYNKSPAASGYLGWVCIGSSFTSTGSITAGASVLTVPSGVSIPNGTNLRIYGSGVAGGNQIPTVLSGGGTTSLTLDTAAVTTVTNAKIEIRVNAWKTFGAISA
jgi:hypothetical protein